MAAKADELGDAVSVYNYLYNNMRSEFYYGSRKGAIGTFEQGGGNDIDLSSLLIAMLRYLGYDADYVTSKAGFTGDQITKWTNTDSVETAHSILSSQGRNNDIVTIEGITYYFYDYKYVQVIDSDKNYYLDVCFKEYEDQQTVYDELDTSNQTENLKSILDEGDISAFNQEIDKYELSALKLPYEKYAYNSVYIVQKNTEEFSTADPHSYDLDIDVSDSLMDDVSDMVFIGFDGGDLLKYRSADLYKKNITVSYEVSSDSKDQADILGTDVSSIFKLPSTSMGQPFSVTPVIKIDGVTVLSNQKLALNIGINQVLHIAIKTGNNNVRFYEENLSAGEMCSIIVDTGQISPGEISQAYTESLKNTESVNQKNGFTANMSDTKLDERNIYTTDYLGSILRLTGVMYFSQVDILTHSLAERENIYCGSELRFGIIGYRPSVWVKPGVYESVGQKDGIQKEGQYFADILGNNFDAISRTGNKAELLSFNFERGLLSSELESTVIEEILNVESLSTASILRYANENEIPIITLSQSSEIKVSDLKIDADDAQRIQKEIDDGNTVVSTQSEVKIGKWSGIGYIVYSPDGISQKYMISGGYNGGSTIDPVPLYFTINVALDLAMIAENILTLTAVLTAMTCLGLGPVAAVLIGVISITFLAIDILEQSFLLYDYEVNDNVEAGVEIWTTTATTSVITLATMGLGKGLSKLSSAVTDSKLSRAYGKTVINNVKNYGFTTSEIGSKVKQFEKLGMTQSTIDTLLKDAKCMYLGDDILKVIGKQGGNSRLLAELVIQNGDDFSKQIIQISEINGTFGVDSVLKEIETISEGMNSIGISTENMSRIQSNLLNGCSNGSVMTTPSFSKGGVPKGKYEPINPSDTIENIESLTAQNKTADIFANHGYDIEMLPNKIEGNGYGIIETGSPDFLIEGKAFDCYSPRGSRAINVASVVAEKTEHQASRIVLNLDNYTGEIDDIVYQFTNPEWRIESLDELFVVKNNKIIRIYLK